MHLGPGNSNKRSNSPGVRSDSRLTVVYRSIASIKLGEQNPRLHGEKQIAQIAKSIQAFGFNVPILLDSELRVLAGHGRVRAARLLGLPQVPTILLEGLTEHQATAFVIADNKITENAAWNPRLLAQQFKSLAEVDLEFSLDATGFDVGEISLLIEGITPVCASDSDPSDVLPKADLAVSRPGDLWLLGKHRIFCGDPLNRDSYSALMRDERAAMVFTSPPGTVPSQLGVDAAASIQFGSCKTSSFVPSDREYSDFLARLCDELVLHSTSGSLHTLFVDSRRMCDLIAAGMQVYSELTDVLVWVRDHAEGGTLYRGRHELGFVFKNNDSPRTDDVERGQCDRSVRNVCTGPRMEFCQRSNTGKSSESHPITKPVALVVDALKSGSARGDLVLDPFMGKGTTLVAAERCQRVCYGIEVEMADADTAVRRWQTLTRQSAIHEISGRSFGKIAREVYDVER